MSHPVQIVLADPAYEQLTQLAAAADRPASTTAAQLVNNGLAQAAKTGQVRPLRRAPITTGHAGQHRAPWLEPYGGDATWRERTWAAILALHSRYPKALENLKDGWWTNEKHVEMLTALATWRTEIDDTSKDPRDEIAYHHQLNQYTHTLNQEAGSVTDLWQPGPAPEEWTPADRLEGSNPRLAT